MNLGDVLIWEATNGLLLIPVVIGLVMLARRLRRQPMLLSVIGYFSSATLARKSSRRPSCSGFGDAHPRGDRWPRSILLRVAVWVRMVRRRGSSHHRRNIAHSAEMVTLTFAVRCDRNCQCI